MNSYLRDDIDYQDFFVKANSSLEKYGYFIAKKLLTEKSYKSARISALDFFKKEIVLGNKLPNALRGDVAAGMENNFGFSRNKSWHIYRYCDFKWNRSNPELENIIKISNELSRIRNSLIGNKETYGEFIEENNYITYTSISLYPSNGGYLKKHRDLEPSQNNPSIIHCKFELTHKGQDYEEGGLFITDKKGRELNISEIAKPRDVIFFDGAQYHQIKNIESSNLGRIAVFDIPTHVTNSSRECIYAGDGYSFPKKLITKLVSNISYLPKKESKASPLMYLRNMVSKLDHIKLFLFSLVKFLNFISK